MTTPDGHVAALVLPQVGDGLLNIVVDARPNHFAAIKPGMPALLEKRRLQIRGLEVTLDRAVVWEACPDWKSLRAATMPSQIAFPCCRPSLYTTPLKAVSWFSCPVGRKAPSCQWGESPSTPPHVSCSQRPPLRRQAVGSVDGPPPSGQRSRDTRSVSPSISRASEPPSINTDTGHGCAGSHCSTYDVAGSQEDPLMASMEIEALPANWKVGAKGMIGRARFAPRAHLGRPPNRSFLRNPRSTHVVRSTLIAPR